MTERKFKVGEIVSFRTWDDKTKKYSLLEGKISKRIDEQGKLSAYMVLCENVCYGWFVEKNLKPKQLELFQ